VSGAQTWIATAHAEDRDLDLVLIDGEGYYVFHTYRDKPGPPWTPGTWMADDFLGQGDSDEEAIDACTRTYDVPLVYWTKLPPGTVWPPREPRKVVRRHSARGKRA